MNELRTALAAILYLNERRGYGGAVTRGDVSALTGIAPKNVDNLITHAVDRDLLTDGKVQAVNDAGRVVDVDAGLEVLPSGHALLGEGVN